MRVISHVACLGEIINIYKILVKKPGGWILIWDLGRGEKWSNRNMVWSQHGIRSPVVGFCIHDNVHFYSIIIENFLANWVTCIMQLVVPVKCLLKFQWEILTGPFSVHVLNLSTLTHYSPWVDTWKLRPLNLHIELGKATLYNKNNNYL